jgi:hypothetical protein
VTPWDLLQAESVPPGVQALALGAAPFSPLSLVDVRGNLAPVLPGVLAWQGTVYTDPTGTYSAREASVTFQPTGVAGAVLVQGFALVDQTGAGTLLAQAWLLTPASLSSQSGALVISGLVVVTRSL